MSKFFVLKIGDDEPVRYINSDYVKEFRLENCKQQYTVRDGMNMRTVDAWSITIFFDEINRDILQLTSGDSVAALRSAVADGDFSKVVIDHVEG